MGMIEVDLLDRDGVIRSVVDVDNIVWTTSGAQMQAMAQERGMDLHAPGGPTEPGVAEREIRSLSDVQRWLVAAASAIHGELTIKHGEKGEVIMIHQPTQPHGEMEDEGPGEPEPARHHHHRHHHHHHGRHGQIGADLVLKAPAPPPAAPEPVKHEGLLKRVWHKLKASFHGEDDDQTPGAGGFAASQYMNGADFPFAPLIGVEGHPAIGGDLGSCGTGRRGSVKG